jgi:hypothetical protein
MYFVQKIYTIKEYNINVGIFLEFFKTSEFDFLMLQKRKHKTSYLEPGSNLSFRKKACYLFRGTIIV